MITEMFLEEDTKELTFDDDKLKEWKEKIEELGLEGQKKLLSKNTDSRPIPFRYMNTSIRRIFKVLCPVEADIKEYSKTPIPLDVLGVIYLAEKDEYFDKIIIRYNDSAPDPIVIGIKGHDEYLIARWGEEKMDIDKMRSAAIKKYTEEKRAILQAKLNNVEQNATEWIDGGYGGGIEYV